MSMMIIMMTIKALITKIDNLFKTTSLKYQRISRDISNIFEDFTIEAVPI